MAATTIGMSTIKQIFLLKEAGTPYQKISRTLGISRNTVKKYIRLARQKRLVLSEIVSVPDQELEGLLLSSDQEATARYEILETFFPYVEKELQRTGVNRWLLWEEYKGEHPDGYSYAHFCYHFRQWCTNRKATMHFEHEPAEKLFIDYTGKKLHWVDQTTGQVNEVEVYVAILGHSQLTYVEAVTSQKKEDFITATENALHYFGGVPKVLIPDNLKSAVDKADKYEARINNDFMDFSNHYQVAVMPARSYKPKDKALVENAVKIAYSRIYAPLRNKVFFSLQELNAAVSRQLDEHNNRNFQKRPTTRREVFDSNEKHLLAPLPTDRYELKEYKSVTVMKNSHVHLSRDKHYYSVPYKFIGRKVKMVYTATTVSVFYNKERIAYHKMDRKNFTYTTVKDHLPSSHRFVADWSPDKFIKWAAGIDPVVEAYIKEVLNSKSFPEQAYKSCVGILAFDKKAGRKRLVGAVKRAMAYNSYSYSTIQRILSNGLDRLEGHDEATQPQIPFHDNIRGASQYQ